MPGPESAAFWRKGAAPEAGTRQPHTYAFHAVHAGHLVPAQRDERFKHRVQDLGTQRRSSRQAALARPSRLRPGPSVLEPENSWPEDHHGAVPISGKEARTSQRVGSGRQDILEGTGPLETNPAGGAATEPAHYVQVSISFPKADPELGRQRLRCYAAPQCGVPPLAPCPWRLCPLTFKPRPTRRR